MQRRGGAGRGRQSTHVAVFSAVRSYATLPSGPSYVNVQSSAFEVYEDDAKTR